MEYKKTIILLALVVFLLSIAGVSASEIDNTISSENANTIELSIDNDIIEDNLQTSEENDELASTDYDEAIAQTDTEVLGEDSAKYSDLAEEIRHSGNIKLNHKNYTYDEGETITISEDNKVIDGNGAVIDMNGSTIRAFHVSASGVTIKNLTIKNANYNGDGGAIYFGSTGNVTNCNFTDNSATVNGGAVYFDGTGTVTNCNFTGNTATKYGGAVYFENSGNVTNCNFTDNSASGDGGAIKMDSGTVSNCNFTNNKATGIYSWGGAIKMSSGTVTNCNFTDNSASSRGGAVYYGGKGDVTNCNFADNSASQGGAIFSNQWYTAADTCIFKRNSGDNVNTVIYPPTLNVNNFTTVYGSGDKLTFDLKTNSSIPVTNGNISISVYFKDGDLVGNYSCLSGEGWIPDLPVGSYIAFFDTEYAEFQKINRTITINPPKHTFWALNYTINGNDNPVIELSNDFYFDPAYDAAFVDGIVINRTVTIKGNGNAIDAKRQARIFYVQSANAVLENLTIINANYDGEGGAIYFRATSGTVSNCNFTGNTAANGGAVYFWYQGTVTNCNFTNNSAQYVGAVYFHNTGNVTNCNFTDNTADYGGAVYFQNVGEVTNCNFTNNSAGDWGGAIMFFNTGTVTNCNFTDNSASHGGAVYFNLKGNVTNCNFTNNKATGTGNYDGGGAVYFYSAGSVTNCNFTDNSAYYGGAVYFYQGTGSLTNCNFTGNNATRDGGAVYFYLGTGSLTNCNFTGNNATRDGGAVFFDSTGTVSNCNFTDNTADYGGAVFFNGNGDVTNCNFTDNTADYGGAVFFLNTGNVTKCNFTDNTASDWGGAVYFNVNGDVTNCNFINNKATGDNACGGAISFVNTGTVTNCNFTGNNATTGSAIYFYSTSSTKTVFNSRFLNNRANAEVLEVTKNDNNITITFTGKNNLLNAIYSNAEVTFTNVTYWGANGIATVSSTMSGSNKAAGQKITVGIVVNGILVLNEVKVTNESGMIVLDISAGENYYISARHDTDSYYTEAEKTISNNINVNVTSQTTTNKTVNITAKSNIISEVMPGKLLFILPNGTQINATYGANGIWWAVHTFDAYGEYKVNATYVGLDNVTVNNATITVNKIKTELSGNAITTTYNINKDLVITLKDSKGNPLTGASVTVDLNGAKTYTTDKNGQVKVSTKGLAPKAYTAKVTFNGNTNYDKSTKDVKVTVKKATPKLTAKKKTFKTSVKTKKYTITLKDNTGKAIKKAKVTLKVKGKTYKATTNSKGKAVFKIKNLKKKGTFKATITYKGNKYYNKVSKKANIKVIVTFKTVSKGSKDKSTVKEIQQALKDHGYYLSYKGHYLKVDGKFQSCTERSVKEFQHDKGLKVTGKVDEKTAKKLGLI